MITDAAKTNSESLETAKDQYCLNLL